MLADISNVDSIYIVCGRTDMRKSIDGLCAIIQDHFSMDVDKNTLYLFCGRKCDRIKGILKEPDGIVIIPYDSYHESQITIPTIRGNRTSNTLFSSTCKVAVAQ